MPCVLLFYINSNFGYNITEPKDRENRSLILKDLLRDLDYQIIAGDTDREITTLVYDSRKAAPGCVFVCIAGPVRDSHDFIPDVIAAGAAAIVVEREVCLPADAPDTAVIRTESGRRALALLSAAYFGYPAARLKTIGITGTKGKTTTTYMVRSILEAAGIRTGLIGTIESIVGDRHIPSANTTPESYRVQELFAQMADAGMEAVVMEVSSQALMLDRVAGITFDLGVFTNLEPDHIGENEHKDFADYMHCKSLLFQQCRKGIFNGDSEYLEGILAGHTCEVETFGYGPDCDLVAEQVELIREHGALGVAYHVRGLTDMDVRVNVPGTFSVYNSLTAIAICRHFGVEKHVIQKALTHVTVKGRIEMVPVSGHYTLMIDYAHNAMSLESLLTTLRAYEPGRLVCLFGCGGNRARSRRFEMGEVSSRLADLTVVTSDNPRYEEPMAIIEDILAGVQKADGAYVTIPDRKEAIAYCMKKVQEGFIIVLAGKGHEDYQEICGVKHPMDERILIREILAEHPELAS